MAETTLHPIGNAVGGELDVRVVELCSRQHDVSWLDSCVRCFVQAVLLEFESTFGVICDRVEELAAASDSSCLGWRRPVVLETFA
jgi:hypothetical protein